MGKRILILGRNSYIGNSFQAYVEENYPGKFETERVSLRGEDWKRADWSGYDSILNVTGKAHADIGSLTEEEKRFIADFYKYSFVGIMLDWIQKGMKEDYRETVEAVCIILHGTIAHSIDNFTKYRK